MCGAAELNFWCEFNLCVVSSDSVDLHSKFVSCEKSPILLTRNQSSKRSQTFPFSTTFQLKLTDRVKYYKNVEKGSACSLMLQP